MLLWHANYGHVSKAFECRARPLGAAVLAQRAGDGAVVRLASNKVPHGGSSSARGVKRSLLSG